MTRFIPLAILIVIIFLGFALKLIELNQLTAKLDFTNEYRNKFIALFNEYINGKLNNQLYIELTEKVVEMQNELGSDGLLGYMIDPWKGISDRNHQVLINFLPEIRTIEQWRDNSIMMKRFLSSAQTCDDMFIRHSGQLKNRFDSERKRLCNPFSCLIDGIRWILYLPANILLWCGFISEWANYKLRINWFLKSLTFLVTIIGLVSSVVTIIIGWEEFCQIFMTWLRQ